MTTRRSGWRFWGRRPVNDVDTELRFHFDMRVAELMERGLTPDQARAAVLARLGDLGAARTECIAIGERQRRKEAVAVMLESLMQDLRLAARTLWRERAWASIAILTLSVGIGATSALFAIINGTLLRPLPFAEPDRIMSISMMTDGRDGQVVDEPSFATWRGQSKTFSALGAYVGAATVLRGSGTPENVRGRSVTRSYFTVLGVRPLLGRTFTPDEEPRDGPRVVILSEQIWRRLYGADSTIIGRTILLDQTPTTVVGVMPAHFTTNVSAQFWLPYRVAPLRAGGTFYTNVIGRLADGATIAGAQAELTTISQRFNATRDADWQKSTPVVMTLHERRYGDTRPALLMLFSAVAVLLLIACANVSNLLLARSTRRQREFALRAAIGASNGRIIRFVLCESVTLSALGALGGLAIAWASVRYFVRIGPATIATAETISLDWMVVAFAVGISLVTGIGFGLLPAFQVRRTDLNSVLTSGGVRMTANAGQARLRRTLVVAELSTALVLFTAAGLLTKSFARVTSIDPGVEPEHVLVSVVDLSWARYRGEAANNFYERFTSAIRGLPGVEAVSLVDAEPLGGARMSRTTKIDGKKSALFDIAGVGNDFFRTLKVPIVAGRTFTPDDRSGEPVVIINQTMQQLVFGGRNPIGERHPIGGDTGSALIVGIARDVLQRGVEKGRVPLAYYPLRSSDVGPYMTVVVRSAGDPGALTPAIRDIVHRLDAQQPAPAFKTLEQSMSDAVAPRRFTFLLLGMFAVIGGLLAAIGLYGVMSYAVAERTNEIGVRVALGADHGRVMRLILSEGMVLTIVGAVLGLAGSLYGVRLLRTMLYQVSIYDPAIFVAGLVALVITALVACMVPALRAARIDPLEAIRAE